MILPPEGELELGVRVAEMRHAFDQIFAAPDPPAAEECEDFVAVRIAGQPFAFRVRELAHIESHRKVVAVPSGRAGLLGLAGIRGKLVPVFSPEVVLGAPPTPAPRQWIAVCRHEAPFGLAFDSLEGYFRVPRSSIIAAADGNQASVQQVVRDSSGMWPVIHLPSIARAKHNS